MSAAEPALSDLGRSLSSRVRAISADPGDGAAGDAGPGQPRRALRPLVESGGRRSGPGPGLADRSGVHGHVPPADLPRHRGRAGRGDRGGQAPGGRHGLPARSTLGDLDGEQLRVALGLRADELVEDETDPRRAPGEAAA